MKNTIAILILLSSMHFWYACSSNTENKPFNLEACRDHPFKYKEYKNIKLKFSVNLPEDYIIDEENDLLQLIAVRDSANEKYIESLGVNVFVNSSNHKLSEIFNEDSEFDIQDYTESSSIKDFTVLGKGDDLINNYDSKWIAYSYGGKSQLSLLIFYFKHENLAYKFSLACNPKNFEALSCKFVKIMKSISFI